MPFIVYMNFIFDIKHFYSPKVKWSKLRKTLKICTARDSSYFKQIKAFYYGFTINIVLNVNYYLERIKFHFVLKTVNIISTIHQIPYFSPNFSFFLSTLQYNANSEQRRCRILLLIPIFIGHPARHIGVIQWSTAMQQCNNVLL